MWHFITLALVAATMRQLPFGVWVGVLVALPDLVDRVIRRRPPLSWSSAVGGAAIVSVAFSVLVPMASRMFGQTAPPELPVWWMFALQATGTAALIKYAEDRVEFVLRALRARTSTGAVESSAPSVRDHTT